MLKTTVEKGNQGKNPVSAHEKSNAVSRDDCACSICGQTVTADAYSRHQQLHLDFHEDLRRTKK
jgi:hypothetical protein